MEVDEPVREGYQFTLRAVDSYDQGPVDNIIGFSYQFNCGDRNGFSYRTYVTQWPCVLDDNVPVWAAVRIYDKDMDYTDFWKSIIVQNVAPWGYFTAESTVAEGQTFLLSVSNPYDPSQADTNASFAYAFDCGDGLSEFGASSSVECPGRESGIVTVSGAIQDKDGGQSTRSRSVTILAPAEVVAETSDDLATLADNPTLEPEAAAAIESAVTELTGNTGGNGGASNGATTLLEKDNGPAAVNKIGKAVASLLDAQVADPTLDLTSEITSLVSMIKAVAEAEIDRAQGVASSSGDQKRIDTAIEAVADGDNLLAAADYLGAADAYESAVKAASSVQ